MSYQLTVVYHHPDDPKAFDAYYESTHAPLASTLPGLRTYTVSRPDRDGEGPPAEYLVASLLFDDAASFGAAMGSEQGQAAVADLGNFATGGVIVLSGEVTTYV